MTSKASHKVHWPASRHPSPIRHASAGWHLRRLGGAIPIKIPAFAGMTQRQRTTQPAAGQPKGWHDEEQKNDDPQRSRSPPRERSHAISGQSPGASGKSPQNPIHIFAVLRQPPWPRIARNEPLAPCIPPGNRYGAPFPAAWPGNEESRRGPAMVADQPAIGIVMKGMRACRFTSMSSSRVRI